MVFRFCTSKITPGTLSSISSQVIAWAGERVSLKMALGLEKPTLRNYNTDEGLRLTDLPEMNGDIQLITLWWGHFIIVCHLRVG